MPLSGDLRDFDLLQLLNLIHLAQKSGCLRLRSSSGNDASLYFEKGLLQGVAHAGATDLVSLLVRRGILLPHQARRIRESPLPTSEKELGLTLINSGLATQEEILQALRTQAQEQVRALLTWKEGPFFFDNSSSLPAGMIPIHLPLENLILEGARTAAHEPQALEQEIPSLDVTLRFPSQPRSDLSKIHLSSEEWRVIRYVRPENTLRQIGRTLHLSEAEVRGIAYRLLQAGIVELNGTRPRKRDMSKSLAGVSAKSEQRNLLQRVIARIRSL